MGVRLVDEFLAKSGTTRCVNFQEVANKIATVAFRMFLGVPASAANFREAGEEKECSILFEETPLTEFVELPEGLQGLKYCNVVAGVIRGALEMVRRRARLRPGWLALWSKPTPHSSFFLSRSTCGSSARWSGTCSRGMRSTRSG